MPSKLFVHCRGIMLWSARMKQTIDGERTYGAPIMLFSEWTGTACWLHKQKQSKVPWELATRRVGPHEAEWRNLPHSHAHSGHGHGCHQWQTCPASSLLQPQDASRESLSCESPRICFFVRRSHFLFSYLMCRCAVLFPLLLCVALTPALG
jgi:hypothetical protein